MSTFAIDLSALKASNDALVAANTKTNAALDNIVGDLVNLNKQISDLKDQLSNGGTVLTAADQAALDALVATASDAAASATAGAAKAKTVADQTPDPPPPPPPPTA